MSEVGAVDPTTGRPGKEYPILWWTTWFWRNQFEGRVVDFCGLPYTCRMTHDRSVYKDTSTVIFHASMFELDTKDTPPLEDAVLPKKAWIVITEEAPKDFQQDPRWTNVFTHLWSYHLTADFVQTYFTGGRAPYSYLWSIMKKPAFTIEEKNQRRREGLAPVAWIASNCKSLNHRQYYVKQLQKFIDVDVYGKCLKNKEWPKNPDGTELDTYEVVAPYKFYLAIENSNCDDYVTEKLERPFALGVVPIVDGPKDYSPFIPTSNSVIKEDDFASPAHLARYLHKLDNDDAAYMRHLSFKYPNSTDAKTWEHLSPKLREVYDTGDGADDWGNDSRGSECKICKFTHDLAEGLTKLDPKHRLPIDRTCQIDKWGKTSWALDFWSSYILLALAVLSLLVTLVNRRARGALLRYAGVMISKVQNIRGSHVDEVKEPFIPRS
ncbi:Alpha-(1,3)-fucosyltransferase 11 [Actinomortierella ambigua]|nr:Alpha-(1,3)-fucosyltransferase 11 [Actinomortierella ambigua]